MTLVSLTDLKEFSKKVPLSAGIILLKGNLGSGKTTFTKTLLTNLNISEELVNSPTFSLIQEYYAENGLKIYHLDLYRLKNHQELQSIGLEDILAESDKALIIIEWPEILGQLSYNHLLIEFEHTSKAEFREIKLKQVLKQ